MTPQEAYKKLDLAKGLDHERVEAQFEKLKAEMTEKILSTSNEKLKEVYTNRLDDVEEAYAVLLEHFWELKNPTDVQDRTAMPPISLAEKKYKTSSKLLFSLVFFSAAVVLTLVILNYVNSLNEAELAGVKIGNQTWMTENLNVDKFRNGEPIPEAKTDQEWKRALENKQPSWCYYNNDPANGDKYGKLYNWYAVNDSRGLAPSGWHVPTDGEWANLIDFLGGEEQVGRKIKSKEGWLENGNGTNESGFLGLPGGNRNENGTFGSIGYDGHWWSSNNFGAYLAWGGGFVYYDGSAHGGSSNELQGFSVRCVKD